MYAKLIYCSECGFKLFSGYQKPRKKWQFEGGRLYHGVYRKDDAVGTTRRCKACPQYSEARLEPIWDSLVEILKNPRNMARPLEKYLYTVKDPLPTKQRLEEINEAIASIRQKVGRVDDMYINGQLSDDKYKNYCKQFKQDEQQLNVESNRLRQSLLSKKEVADRQKAIAAACEKIRVKLDNLTYEEKSRIVSYFVERIILHAKEDYAEVVFKFPGDTETKGEKIVSLAQKPLPLLLNIKTISEKERRSFILKNNPGMYLPKALV